MPDLTPRSIAPTASVNGWTRSSRDRSIHDPTITVVENEGSSELHVGPRLVMVVTPQDARSLGGARAARRAVRQGPRGGDPFRTPSLRASNADAIGNLRRGRDDHRWLLAVWLIFLVTGWIRRRIDERWSARTSSLRVQQAEILSAEGVGHTIDLLVRAVRFFLVLLLLDLYLTYVLGLFPWTRAVSPRCVGYVITPFRGRSARAFVGYLPKLLFVIVIARDHPFRRFAWSALFFDQIEQGRIVFANFPAEWADPTNKIVRVLLIAFGLVVAFPYLPASDSPAFAGVSVFMGVLFSLASSSALSNMIAGIVLTYTGAFRLGDRVKVGDAFGDIIETSLLATRVRTIKNEDITIPNSLVLGTSIMNYSRESKTLGLILHTSVTIGYDAPWRQVHDLLDRGRAGDARAFSRSRGRSSGRRR